MKLGGSEKRNFAVYGHITPSPSKLIQYTYQNCLNTKHKLTNKKPDCENEIKSMVNENLNHEKAIVLSYKNRVLGYSAKLKVLPTKFKHDPELKLEYKILQEEKNEYRSIKNKPEWSGKAARLAFIKNKQIPLTEHNINRAKQSYQERRKFYRDQINTYHCRWINGQRAYKRFVAVWTNALNVFLNRESEPYGGR